MTANHNRQAQEYAFHAFGGQSDGWDGCNLTGGKSLAVAQPKNRALSFLVFSCRNLPQDFVNLLELKTLAHRGKAISDGGFQAVLDGFYDRFSLAGTALGGQRSLEMIVDYVGRNHLQESINRILLPRLERPQ